VNHDRDPGNDSAPGSQGHPAELLDLIPPEFAHDQEPEFPGACRANRGARVRCEPIQVPANRANVNRTNFGVHFRFPFVGFRRE